MVKALWIVSNSQWLHLRRCFLLCWPLSVSGYIAKLTNDNEATFKKLFIDGIHKYLKGLNPRWPMMPVRGEQIRTGLHTRWVWLSIDANRHPNKLTWLNALIFAELVDFKKLQKGEFGTPTGFKPSDQSTALYVIFLFQFVICSQKCPLRKRPLSRLRFITAWLCGRKWLWT